jgi:hypothetical protein
MHTHKHMQMQMQMQMHGNAIVLVESDSQPSSLLVHGTRDIVIQEELSRCSCKRKVLQKDKHFCAEGTYQP